MPIDILVYPFLSPRIIEIDGIAYPDVSMQDLYNAIREYEDSYVGQIYEYLVNAAGKENLGGGVSVGITVTLNNTRVLFKGNLTPLDDGSGRTCDATDATGRQLYVDDADFISDSVSIGDTIHNKTTNEWATITEIVDQYTLNHLELDGNGKQGWTSGDNYEVFENIQCNLSGGNIVAIDDVDADLDPVIQSPFVQIVKTSASSATLQSQAQMEHATFNGGITIDVVNGTSGTDYPIGTSGSPVNNLADAKIIAAERGFKKLFIMGDFTVGATDNVDGYEFHGQSMDMSTITFVSGCSNNGSEFYNLTMSGVLGGGHVHAMHCILNGLTGAS